MSERSLYYIALVPNSEVASDVQNFKLEAKNKYGTKRALRSIAHITLVPSFNAIPEELSAIADVMEEASNLHKAINVLTAGFDHFKSHTIYIKIINSPNLEDIYQSIYPKVTNIVVSAKYNRFVPHITIANSDIPEEKFFEMYEYFKKIGYVKNLSLGKLVLFKLENESWQECKTYKLK